MGPGWPTPQQCRALPTRHPSDEPGRHIRLAPRPPGHRKLRCGQQRRRRQVHLGRRLPVRSDGRSKCRVLTGDNAVPEISRRAGCIHCEQPGNNAGLGRRTLWSLPHSRADLRQADRRHLPRSPCGDRDDDRRRRTAMATGDRSLVFDPSRPRHVGTSRPLDSQLSDSALGDPPRLLADVRDDRRHEGETEGDHLLGERHVLEREQVAVPGPDVQGMSHHPLPTRHE